MLSAQTIRKTMVFDAPRLPADPLARSEFIRSFVCSLHALQAPCLGTTLGGAPPPENPTPRDHHPQGPPTPPQPPVSPSGRLFRVDGYSKWMAFPSAWLFRGVLLQLNTRACSDSASVGSLYLLSSHNAAPLVRISPRSTPRAPQEHPGAHQEHPVAPRSTREHPGALEPV